jgi:hypothetical protein
MNEAEPARISYPGEGGDLANASGRKGAIPAFAAMASLSCRNI